MGGVHSDVQRFAAHLSIEFPALVTFLLDATTTIGRRTPPSTTGPTRVPLPAKRSWKMLLFHDSRLVLDTFTRET
jgi:hypothetical protein